MVAHNRDEFVRRKYRVMNLLASMFDSSDWLIVHSPFIYSAGITKSVTLCDVRAAILFFTFLYIYPSIFPSSFF